MRPTRKPLSTRTLSHTTPTPTRRRRYGKRYRRMDGGRSAPGNTTACTTGTTFAPAATLAMAGAGWELSTTSPKRMPLHLLNAPQRTQ